MVQQFRQDGTNGCAKGVQKYPSSATPGIVRRRARGSERLYQSGHARRGPICENLDSSVRLARSPAKAAHRARRRRAIYRADQGIRGRRRSPHSRQRFEDSPPCRRILGSAHGSREVLLERSRPQGGEATSNGSRSATLICLQKGTPFPTIRKQLAARNLSVIYVIDVLHREVDFVGEPWISDSKHRGHKVVDDPDRL